MHKHFSKYTRTLIGKARKLRRDMTDAERRLWKVLRANQAGVRFRRQVPLWRYILDFYCHRLKLDVELDGGQHYTEEGLKDDAARDGWLRKNEIKVIRFSDYEVLTNIEGVKQEIYENVAKGLRETPPSSSPKRGGGSTPLKT